MTDQPQSTTSSRRADDKAADGSDTALKTAPHRVARYSPAPKPVLRGWRTAVVAVNRTANATHNRSSSLKPKTSSERWQLAKAIQGELKRVGCYWGKIDGIWGKGSKWAMADFMQSVNATLPTKDPDYILLQLVSSHTEKICGRSNDGTQIAALTPPKTPSEPQSSWVAQVDAATVNTAPTRTTASGGTKVAAGIETASIQSGPGRPQRIAAAKPRPAALPGRMSIGALNRDSTPKLLSPPTRLSRRVAAVAVGEAKAAANHKIERHLKISAIPTPMSDAQPRTRQVEATDNTDGQTSTPPVQVSPFVAKKKTAAKAKRARALRKAAVNKKKRKRGYRSRYRSRSLQTMFMHPLGRR